MLIANFVRPALNAFMSSHLSTVPFSQRPMMRRCSAHERNFVTFSIGMIFTGSVRTSIKCADSCSCRNRSVASLRVVDTRSSTASRPTNVVCWPLRHSAIDSCRRRLRRFAAMFVHNDSGGGRMHGNCARWRSTSALTTPSYLRSALQHE